MNSEYPYNSHTAHDIKNQKFFNELSQTLPPIFSRHVASQAIGGLISEKTMSNEDSLGCGPSVRMTIGNRVAYERDSFLEWLRKKIKSW
jgi:hypothetical protein